MFDHGGMEALEAVEVVIEASARDVERLGQRLRLQGAVSPLPESLKAMFNQSAGVSGGVSMG